MKTNKPHLARVAKYIRVSTDKQARTGDSLREQDDTLSEYINRNSDMILFDTYIDDGISGQKIKRDEFTRLMDDVKSGHIDLIIFTKLDRWFRSLRHYLNTQIVLEKNGVSWTAVSQPFFDTSTAHGRAFVAQSMTWAELEAQNDSERILAVFKNKVKNGEVISGTTPLGYDIIDKHLVPNGDAEKVIKMYEFYRKEPNLRGLMRYASSEFGIVRTHNTLKRLLQNTKYKGIYRDNTEYCPPLVSAELWNECNRLLDRNQRSNKTHDYVFTGLIVCANCEKKMSAAIAYKHKNGEKCKAKVNDEGRIMYQYPAYKCQSRTSGRNCINKKFFYESTLERKVLKLIKPTIEKHITGYNASIAPAVNNEAKRQAIRKKIDKLKELYVNELITMDEFKKDRLNYEEMIDALPVANVAKKDFTILQKILEMDIETPYKIMSKKEKNFFWRSFIDEIWIDNDHDIDIHLL